MINPPAGTPDVYTIPVVVHVIHTGEPVGVGHNLSRERIEGQIRSLNDDFRRRPGTRGHNTHPDGGDARIEFVLASVAPDGTPTDGIVRVDASTTPNPTPPGSLFDYYAHFSYWDPERYVTCGPCRFRRKRSTSCWAWPPVPRPTCPAPSCSNGANRSRRRGS